MARGKTRPNSAEGRQQLGGIHAIFYREIELYRQYEIDASRNPGAD